MSKYVTFEELRQLTGLSGARAAEVSRQEAWNRKLVKGDSGHKRYLFLRSDVESWADEHGKEGRRLLDFIAMKDAVDALTRKPTEAQMAAIARYPFTVADVRSLVETRPYREAAKA